MQALSECVKASQDPRCRSNRPWTSQVWRPATGAGWKHPRCCSPTQTRRTGSRLPRAEAAAATTTTSTTTMRNPGIMRRPKSLHLTIFVNEIKTSIQKPFSFREAKKRLPLQIHLPNRPLFALPFLHLSRTFPLPAPSFHDTFHNSRSCPSRPWDRLRPCRLLLLCLEGYPSAARISGGRYNLFPRLFPLDSSVCFWQLPWHKPGRSALRQPGLALGLCNCPVSAHRNHCLEFESSLRCQQEQLQEAGRKERRTQGGDESYKLEQVMTREIKYTAVKAISWTTWNDSKSANEPRETAWVCLLWGGIAHGWPTFSAFRCCGPVWSDGPCMYLVLGTAIFQWNLLLSSITASTSLAKEMWHLQMLSPSFWLQTDTSKQQAKRGKTHIFALKIIRFFFQRVFAWIKAERQIYMDDAFFTQEIRRIPELMAELGVEVEWGLDDIWWH